MKRHKQRKRLIVAVAGLFLCNGVFDPILAQTAKIGKANHQKGILTGRVFAITKGGDLKPARIATVHILFYGGADTAGTVYVQETMKATDAFSAELQKNRGDWSERYACLKELGIYSSTMLKVMEWSESKQIYDQVVNLQTDEEGFFSITLPPGIYIVTARGRAGANQAVWDTSLSGDVTLKPGSHLDVKLSSPSKSCPDSSD
jgi:hypothetical protein